MGVRKIGATPGMMGINGLGFRVEGSGFKS